MSSTVTLTETLRKFIERAKTTELRKKDIVESVENLLRELGIQSLKGEVSFGRYTPSRIPWIAFLPENGSMKVSHGIYPVYLYYKNHDKLILAYGISETNTPNVSWPPSIIKSSRKIEDVLPEAEHYKDSYVFKEYQVNGSSITDLSGNPISEDQLLNDLKTILDQYIKDVLHGLGSNSAGTTVPEPEAEERLLFETINEELYLPEDFDFDALIAAVKSGNVLLYGPPGTGKTKLAKMLASKLEGTDPEIYTANSLWFRRDVIGGETIVNGSVQWKSGFLIRACNTAGISHGSRYHFIIIDEMNRADADKAFGDFFTIFSSLNPDDWEVPASLIEEIKSYNGRIDEEARNFLKICENRDSSKEILKKLRIIATINTADINNLYLLGEALLRRFYLIEISCVKPEKTAEEVNFLIRKNGYTVSDETKSAFIDFVKNLRSRFESYAQGSDYEKKRLGEFCISTAAVERALKMISEMGSVTPDRFPLLLKMSLGTVDDNILKEIG